MIFSSTLLIIFQLVPVRDGCTVGEPELNCLKEGLVVQALKEQVNKNLSKHEDIPIF